MAEIAVSEDLEDRMNEFPEIDWSSVARKAIAEKLEKLAFMKHFASESKVTEEESIEFGRKLNRELAKWYEGR